MFKWKIHWMQILTYFLLFNTNSLGVPKYNVLTYLKCVLVIKNIILILIKHYILVYDALIKKSVKSGIEEK